MRIDLVLKYLCLVKSRSLAKTLCDRGRVLIDGEPARPSADIHDGARVSLLLPRRTLTVEISRVPEKQLSKAKALDYYRRVETPPGDVAFEEPDPLDDL